MKLLCLVMGYLAAVMLPLAVSAWVGGPPREWHQELASGFGILAFSMLLVEFVLSGRFKAVSNGVGLDVTMRFHQVLARTALVFAFLHPLFYQGTPTAGPRPWDPTRALTITNDFSALSTGIIAYLLLAGLAVLAIGRKQLDYKYETWRLLHGLGALVIALLLLHHTLAAGRYGSHPVMVWVWVAMTGLAVGSLLVVYIIVPLQQKARPWRVSSVVQLTPRQWQVTAEPEGHRGLQYMAGQFVWLNLGHSPFLVSEHPFSICSAPAGGTSVSFMIRELGDFTRTIGQIQTGTVAYVDGPYGNLCVDGRTEPGIGLIAGGVGLAPLLGILRQLQLTGDPRPVKLIYGNRMIDQIAYREELDERLGTDGVTYVLSEPPQDWTGKTGMIEAPLLDGVFTAEEFHQWVFVLCGPGTMMDTVEDHLIERGTPAQRILSERFSYD